MSKTESGNNDKPLPALADMPATPADAKFELRKIERVALPHPYCITPKHVEVAADQFGGRLNADAIRAAEKQGAACGICRTERRKIHSTAPALSYDEHEQQVTLFIALEDSKNLNSEANRPMREFLCDNKPRFVELGIEGFAFPTL